MPKTEAPRFIARVELGSGRVLLQRGRAGDATRSEALWRSAVDLAGRYSYAFVECQVARALVRLDRLASTAIVIVQRASSFEAVEAHVKSARGRLF